MRTALGALAIALLLGTTSFASIIYYSANLVGSLENPPTGSPGTGSALVILDTTAQTLSVHVTFSGLEGTTTASHIHCCTAAPGTGDAGVATTTPTFAGFPLGVMSGTYDNVLDLTLSSSYNPAFVTAQGGLANAESALLAGLAANETYLNVHSSIFGGGEIRGYLATPEPGMFLATGAVLAGLLSGVGLARLRALLFS